MIHTFVCDLCFINIGYQIYTISSCSCLESQSLHQNKMCWYIKGPFILHRKRLRCRTAEACDVTALRRVAWSQIYCNLKCSDAAVTCGRDVIHISAPQRNWGIVWTDHYSYVFCCLIEITVVLLIAIETYNWSPLDALKSVLYFIPFGGWMWPHKIPLHAYQL